MINRIIELVVYKEPIEFWRGELATNKIDLKNAQSIN